MQRQSADSIALFGRTNFHGDNRIFGIRDADRLAHMYAIGKTGTGKSTLLETLIRHDIRAGNGLALLDPHGDLVGKVRTAIPESRRADVINFDVPDHSQNLTFNPLERVAPAKRPFAASALLEVFKKVWPAFWGPRSEHILRNALLALLEQPEATLADVLRLFDEKDYRQRAAERVLNSQVRRFWLKEYEGYPARFRAEAIAPIQNKVGAFLADPVLNRILTAPRSSFDLRRLMDDGKILLVNVAKGRLGEDTAALLGALLVSMIGVTGLSRADTSEDARRPFFVYLDEFQTFTTLSLANMLSELRKYGLGMILAHQYLSQLDPTMRDAILGNVGTLVCFRIGALDADLIRAEFAPEVSGLDLTRLPNYQVYLKLMVSGVITSPFSAETLPMKTASKGLL